MSAVNPFSRRAVIVIVLLAAVLIPLLLSNRLSSQQQLVVYCAHDAVFADSMIRRFEAATGIRVDVRYDEEASKSLGLTNLLIAEKAAPRCDVFWNNQTLGTIRLKQEGVLAECDPSLLERIPQSFKDPDGQWAGFAARLRVWIVNTNLMPGTEDAVAAALAADSLAHAAIAVPLYGTTFSHYAVLCQQWGIEGLKAWHQSLHERGIREVRGNGAVRDLVAEGACSFGFTDTDDAFAAIDAGKPVMMLPVRTAQNRTICIPNSVAIIRGCRNPEAAAKFVAWLLSEESELTLAKSASRQIPLGPVDSRELPADVRQLIPWAAESVSMNDAAKHDQEVLDWLMQEYAGQ